MSTQPEPALTPEDAKRIRAYKRKQHREWLASERSLWINNDEGLYNWWQRTKMSEECFIKWHWRDIDAVRKQAQR